MGTDSPECGGFMITICAVENEGDAETIRKVTKEMLPECLFVSAGGVYETGQKISADHPEVVWLEATPDNYDMISSLENTGGINFILVSDDIEKAFDAVLLRASGFICRPVTEKAVSEELRRLRYPLPCMNSLKVQCFGNFEVFFRGKIVKFSRSRSKEAFAYLVDRRGAGCSVRELCSVLWEDRQIDDSLKSQCRVIMSGLRKDLEEAGAADVLNKGWNVWSVDTEKISCDFYDFLRDRKRYADLFMGEYMSQYSWAELTRGSLYSMTEYDDE